MNKSILGGVFRSGTALQLGFKNIVVFVLEGDILVVVTCFNGSKSLGIFSIMWLT